MMNLRQLKQSDIPRLKQLHAESGFNYPFPDIHDMLPIPAIVDDQDQVVMAIGSMPMVEVYFFLDSSWETPGMKMEAFKVLHEFVRQDLNSRGFIEANAFVPPQVSKSFGRRLMSKFGWRKSEDGWSVFSRRTD